MDVFFTDVDMFEAYVGLFCLLYTALYWDEKLWRMVDRNLPSGMDLKAGDRLDDSFTLEFHHLVMYLLPLTV